MMSKHETLALGHPRIVAFQKFFSEYHLLFEITGERFRVSLRIYESNDGRFLFEQSHFIRTPLQDSAQVLTQEKHSEPHIALAHGVESITSYFDEAVSRGHQPSEDWFIRNTAF